MQNNITKISQVTQEVTLFLRKLGLSNYYIIKIYALVGDAAIALTEDNPYWLLEEFPSMRFAKVDEVASAVGVEKNSFYRIQAAIKHGLAAYISNGHTFVPAREFCTQMAEHLDLSSEAIEDVMEDMALSGDLQLSVVDGVEVLYFYGYYKVECQIVSKLIQMVSYTPKTTFADIDAIIRKAEAEKNIILSSNQRDAIKNSIQHSLSIITGGPGTGKTTIIRTLIHILESGNLKVAVASPTGRAAKRIAETTGKPAITVHRLLDYYYDEELKEMVFGKNQQNQLDYDAIIIDETSMMDLMLMGALCRAVKDDCRMIFVGDADQLPSVGAGNVLSDCINSGYIFTSKLTEVFRQSNESNIISNAHRINKGEYPEFGNDFVLIEAEKQQDIVEKITKMAANFDLSQIQVLTPMKKGLLGSHNLNVYLQKIFNPEGEQKQEIKFGDNIFRCGDRVMQIKNNYRLEFVRRDGSVGKGVFNGETGTIQAVYTEEKKLVVSYDDDRWVEYPYVQLDEIELAYAVTIHKSQGSEFPVVIIPMSWFPPALATRNLIYTAITRAQERVIIVGKKDYLNAMVDNIQMSRRNSGLKARICQVYDSI